MLTRPLTLSDDDDRGRDLSDVAPPPPLSLAQCNHDDTTQTGVVSPVPLWSSSSSSSSPPCASSPSSALSITPSFLSFPSFTPPPSVTLSSLTPPSPLASYTFTPPPVAPSSFPPPPTPLVAPYTFTPPLQATSSFTPPSSSAPSPFTPPSGATSFASPPSLAPFSFTPSPPVALSSCSPPPSSAPSPFLPPPVAPLSTSLSCYSFSTPRPVFTAPAPSVTPPPLFTPPVSAPSVAPPPLSTPPLSAPSVTPPACCPCSSLLPRLLSAHRMEVRHLLRGALASLGRRLDSLERRSRRNWRKRRSKQRQGGAACSPVSVSWPAPPLTPTSPHGPTSSCGSALLLPVHSSSSPPPSENENSPTPPLTCNLNQSEKRRRSRGEEQAESGGRRRRRRRDPGGGFSLFPSNKEKDEEEEDAGRFVGRMVVSFKGGGAKEEALLTLHNFNKRKHRRRQGGGAGQSEKALRVVGQNGVRASLLTSSFSHHALPGHSLGQSDVLAISSGRWRFSEFAAPLPVCFNDAAFSLWLSSSPSCCSPAPMLRLSAVAVETMTQSVRGGAYVRPLRPLRDWTAPPSLSSDHSYMRPPSLRPTFSARQQQRQKANHSSRSHLPRRRPLPLPPCPTSRLSMPLPTDQSAAGAAFLSCSGERGKRVSQIRIRRASPRETPLTPMGLPKAKRLKKKEFSLEEIYTNKNYKSPTTNRSLETIFEEPREKDGALLLIGQQRRRRLLLFPDFTQPRKRKRPQGVGLPVAMVPRKRAAARRQCQGTDDDADLDVMLVERLSALEDFLTRQGLEV